jgi:hypothetical protein
MMPDVGEDGDGAIAREILEVDQSIGSFQVG